MAWKSLFLFLFFISFYQLVSASNDFVAYSDSTIGLCCSEPLERFLFITNGDFENFFTIEASGPASRYVAFSPDAFLLKPGEKAVISEFVNVPCERGTFELVVRIRTDTNLVKEFRQVIESSPCNNVGIRLVYRNDTGCRCNVLAYVFNVSNAGSYSERYKFSVSSFSDYALFIPEDVELEPGMGAIVNLVMTPECSASSGSFDFVSRAERSGFAGAYPLRMNINSSCRTDFPLYEKKRDFSRLLLDSLIYFPVVIIVLALLVFIILRARRNKDETIRSDKKYSWESRFRSVQAEKRFDFGRLLLLLLAVFVLAAIVFVSYRALSGSNADLSGFAAPFKAIFGRGAAFLSSYFVYVLLGIIILVVVISVIELLRLKKAE
ncbi:hypothetical protein HYU11_02750 [Candidatus Woesearchaeota archaeon]|nr:hypothetical protein [Candidatus Woesearchaeota archaeon]